MRNGTLILIAAATLASAQDDAVMKALRDEMARSAKELQLEKLERPYFVSYRVQEIAGRTVAASFGALTSSNPVELRLLQVEVRVGDPKLDNTNFFAPGGGSAGVARMYGGVVQAPLEDDYRELRRQLWLATDGAYKKALEDLSRKRAALENKTRSENLPDFSEAPPAGTAEELPPVAVSAADLERSARQLSALFRQMPDVATSTVQYSIQNTRAWFLSSEGTSYRRSRPSVSFSVRAGTQAPDGMPLEDFAFYAGRSTADLPSEEQLAARIREIGDNLRQLRAAATIDQYTGPALIEGRAAAELVAQALAPNLLGTRRPVSDNQGFERYAQQLENPLLDRLGGRVLPDFFTVTDNPTQERHGGAPLAGWRKVDDEGVPAREVKLVEKGLLKTVLTTRNPVRGAPGSTGSRTGAGPMPSNLFLTAEGGVSSGELRQKFLELLKQRGKEYGIAIRAFGNPSLRAPVGMQGFLPAQPGESRVEPAVLAYKVYPDGREELVRNAQLSAVAPAMFRDILAASSEQTVYTAPFRPRNMPGTFSMAMLTRGNDSGLVSFVVPSLLFEDVTIKKPSGEVPKPPVAGHPFFDK